MASDNLFLICSSCQGMPMKQATIVCDAARDLGCCSPMALRQYFVMFVGLS